ncbi:MAG: YdcF family protein [Deltaproteobacteria bacterium]|nr:YdcF family protein [Deltaproteobacteria bacterium]
MLTAIGSALIVDDPPAPVDALVVSMAALRPSALEAARLHRDGIGRRIVIARWQPEALDDEMRRLGVPWLPPHELAAAMLVQSGVPSTAIELLDDSVDGLNTEIAAVAAWVRRTQPESLLYLTARSHTRRASWMLHRLLAADVRFLVHAPARDAFRPDGWWRSRTGSREVTMEYLRWVNTFALGDLWRREPASVPEPFD